jgi:hypothetical protein
MIKVAESARTGKFKTPLCDWCHDTNACLLAHCFPCYTHPKAWSAVRGEECTICHCLCFADELYIRTNIRHARGMELNYEEDGLLFVLCGPFPAIQDYQEAMLLLEERVDAESQLPPVAL